MAGGEGHALVTAEGRAENDGPKTTDGEERTENGVANTESGALHAPDFLIRSLFFGPSFSVRPFRSSPYCLLIHLSIISLFASLGLFIVS